MTGSSGLVGEEEETPVSRNYCGSERRAAIGEKDGPAKGALADRRMAAIDPLGEGLCAPVSLHFNGFSRAESPVNV